MLAEGKKPKFLRVVRADPELVEAISRATQVETWRGHCCCCQVDLALPEGGSFAYFATNSCAQESGGGIAGGGGRRRCSGTGGQVVKVSLRAQARLSRGAAPLSARTNCFFGTRARLGWE